jgi:hypothetical protein
MKCIEPNRRLQAFSTEADSYTVLMGPAYCAT